MFNSRRIDMYLEALGLEGAREWAGCVGAVGERHPDNVGALAVGLGAGQWMAGCTAQLEHVVAEA